MAERRVLSFEKRDFQVDDSLHIFASRTCSKNVSLLLSQGESGIGNDYIISNDIQEPR